MRRTPLAGALLLLAVGLAACGEDEEPGPDAGPGARLASLDGVRDAAVGRTEVEQGLEVSSAVVDLDPDATAGQVAAVLDAVVESDVESTTVYLGAGSVKDLGGPTTAGVDGIWDLPAGASTGEWSELLVRGAAAVDPATVAVSPEGGGARPRLDVAVAEVDPAGVTAALAALAGEPVLAAVDDVTVSAFGEGGTAADGLVGGLQVDDDGGVDAGDVAAWQGLARAVAAWPEGSEGSEVAVSLLQLRTGAQAPRVVLDLVLPADVAPRQLTPQRWGVRVWPLVRPVLDAARAMPAGTLVEVSDGRGDTVVSVEVGAPAPGPDRLGRTWSARAAAYLAR